MAFNVSALTNYVDQNSRELAIKTVLASQSAKLFKDSANFQTGVKGEQAIQILSADVKLQDGSDCGRTPSGEAKLSQKKVKVSPIKDEQNFCPKALESKWTSQYLTKGQTYTELLFAQEIMDARANLIAEANEKLIWQGDSASVDANLNRLDGLLKQIVAGDKIEIVAASTALTVDNVISELQKAVLAMPVAIRDSEDARLFIGSDVYAMYTVALANKNIYKPTEDLTLFGTTTKLAVVSGLNGTKAIVMARLSNIVYAVDLMGEDAKASLTKSVETNQFYMDFHYAFGVTVVFGDEVGYGLFD